MLVAAGLQLHLFITKPVLTKKMRRRQPPVTTASSRPFQTPLQFISHHPRFFLKKKPSFSSHPKRKKIHLFPQKTSKQLFFSNEKKIMRKKKKTIFLVRPPVSTTRKKEVESTATRVAYLGQSDRRERTRRLRYICIRDLDCPTQPTNHRRGSRRIPNFREKPSNSTRHPGASVVPRWRQQQQPPRRSCRRPPPPRPRGGLGLPVLPRSPSPGGAVSPPSR